MEAIEKYLPAEPVSIVALCRLWECSEMTIRLAIRDKKLQTGRQGNRHSISRFQAETYIRKFGPPKRGKEYEPQNK